MKAGTKNQQQSDLEKIEGQFNFQDKRQNADKPQDDVVIFYTQQNDISSICQDQSQYLIEDFDDQEQLLNNLAINNYHNNNFKNQNFKDANCEAQSTKPNNDCEQPSKTQTPSSTFSCCKMIPQILFFMVVVTIIAVCVMDMRMVMSKFNLFIEWAKIHPYYSIGYSIAILCLSITFTIPISYTIIMLGYTYAQVFNSKLYGLLFSVPIIFTGCLSGAIVAFLMSRYMFRDFMKTQINAYSPWLAWNFKMMNMIVQTDGCKIVALIRLTFAPFGITSYILGCSDITLCDYILGNITYIFNCTAQCFIGCSLYEAAANENNVLSHKQQNDTRISFMIEVVLTILITIAIGYVSKNIIEKKLQEQEGSSHIDYSNVSEPNNQREPPKYLQRPPQFN